MNAGRQREGGAMSRASFRKWGTVLIAALTAAVLGAGALRAHEGHGHEAKGTVKAIESAKLTLDTTEGETVEFVLDESTKFVRGTTAVKREDVAVGERAIVTYHEMQGMKHVSEVKLAEKKP
jgi:hypothetical protein